MANYYWRNAQNDRDGTDGRNYDDGEGVPYVEGNPPGIADDVYFDGGEDLAELPNVMPESLGSIHVRNAYADVTDFTDFAVGASWASFCIEGVSLVMSGTPTIVAGGVLGSNGILDTANPIATAGDCTINWASGTFDIFGGINASHAITHTLCSGSKLTCDVPGTLNLGGDADDLQIENTAAITFGDDIVCGDFTKNGNLDMAGHGISTNGDYISSNGTMANAGTLTMTGTGVSLQSGPGHHPNDLVLDAAASVTLTGHSYFKNGAEIPDGATLALGDFGFRPWNGPDTDNSLHCEGNITVGTGTFELYISGSDISNSPIVDIGSIPLLFRVSAAEMWTQTGPLTCGDLGIMGYGAGDIATLDTSKITLIASGIVTLGAGSLNRSGVLILGPTAAVGSIAAGNSANLGNALTIGACALTASGKITLDYIAATISTGSIVATDLDIGTSGALVASGDFTTNADVLIDGGTFNLASGTWTQTNGDAFARTSGTFTCTADYSATIDGLRNTLTDITATNRMKVIHGIDGGGNTKLRFYPRGGIVSKGSIPAILAGRVA